MTLHNITNKIGLIALAIPFLAMTFMIGTNLRQLQNTEYRFAIAGYDPRDLLRGHYLIFQYVWPDKTENNCTDKEAKNCCACFHQGTTQQSVSFESCDRATDNKICHASLKMETFWNGTFQPHENLRRYYIPEEHAAKLEDMLRDNTHEFEVGLVPATHKKSGKVKMLYIDNIALPQFLTEQPENQAAD